MDKAEILYVGRRPTVLKELSMLAQHRLTCYSPLDARRTCKARSLTSGNNEIGEGLSESVFYRSGCVVHQNVQLQDFRRSINAEVKRSKTIGPEDAMSS